ncbi:FecR family protein [Stutzerimonas urumqiensis]|uniref:FecR family protein n=1 Tax=Stutzerimonas urumqiensis TaxID=638269 RepID=UPI000EABE662|nr:FecR family protein [Stutzerimonas urumqiensis]
MTSDAPVPEAVLRAAIDWKLRLDDGEPDIVSRLERWLAEDERHRRAWNQLGTIDRHLDPVRPPVTRQVLQRSARKRPPLLRSLAVAATLIGALGLTDRLWPLGHWTADVHTGRGEQHSLRLPDDSHLQLNSRSAIDLLYSDQERRIRLREGEVLVDTAARGDPRPFIIETAEGTFRALGTRFLVRTHAGSTRLVVLAAAVAASPGDTGQTRIVRAGEQIIVSGNRLGPSEPAPPGSDAWSRGLLVVQDVPLGDLLEQLDDYHTGHLSADPTVARLRITGTFPLTDTERALNALTLSLPVQVERTTDWWLRLVPADR